MADKKELRVALVGYGYWGPNLARNLHKHPDIKLVAIVDERMERRHLAARDYPSAMITDVIREETTMPGTVATWDDIDAAVIATPPENHYAAAYTALDHGKHVLVEKPMTLSTEFARRLLLLAEEQKVTLMVDHIYCHSAAALKIKSILETKEIGDLLYIDSTRINLGLYQDKANVLWDLAVHDFSLLQFFFPDLEPACIQAKGTRHHTDLHDTAHVLVDFRKSPALAHFHVSWLSPVKVRQMLIVGAEKSIVWNDMDPVEPVRLHTSSAKYASPAPGSGKHWQMEYRRGDVWVPRVGTGETLYSMVDDFVEAIQFPRKPLTDGRAGKSVVEMLVRADDSLRANSRPIEV